MVACTGLAFAAGFAGAASAASAPDHVPQAGNWEGSGPHGLPLSFSLVSLGGRLRATSIAVGAPLACPPRARDAEGVPLSLVNYSGPGGTTGQPDGSAMLSGEVPGRGRIAQLTGYFTSPTAGTFSLQVNSTVGCGWPRRTLTWHVHRAGRRRVGDGVWTASLRGQGISSGTVKVTVAGLGRVVRSFRTAYTCRSAAATGNGGFAAVPAYEFIRPDGSFYSPLHGNALKGHRTLWSGRFTRNRGLVGTLEIFDPCAGGVVPLRFQR